MRCAYDLLLLQVRWRDKGGGRTACQRCPPFFRNHSKSSSSRQLAIASVSEDSNLLICWVSSTEMICLVLIEVDSSMAYLLPVGDLDFTLDSSRTVMTVWFECYDMMNRHLCSIVAFRKMFFIWEPIQMYSPPSLSFYPRSYKIHFQSRVEVRSMRIRGFRRKKRTFQGFYYLFSLCCFRYVGFFTFIELIRQILGSDWESLANMRLEDYLITFILSHLKNCHKFEQCYGCFH